MYGSLSWIRNTRYFTRSRALTVIVSFLPTNMQMESGTIYLYPVRERKDIVLLWKFVKVQVFLFRLGLLTVL